VSFVITCYGLAGSVSRNPRPAPVGQLLQSYDPEAHGGQGTATWTPDPAKALRFATAKAAHEFWNQVSKSRPVRADGQPNRPLTAFTVLIEDLP
jgi:hypothetical protein